MKETICTIPINDIWGEKKGCPICRMYEMLEEQYANFITGSAMMDPQTRVQTNQKGFCERHFIKITQVGKRLPNALILQTHLGEIMEKYMPKDVNSKPDKKKLQALKNMQESCYICDRIRFDAEHFMQTVFVQWQKSEDFRKLYTEQEYICLDHYRFVTELSVKYLPSKLQAPFHADTATLCKNQLRLLIDDTSHFCKMFDYQSRGADWGNSRDAIERDLEFLVKIHPETRENTEE
ncbi:MAG: DUF6062 family protein [Eubacteriales bacterium]|nr:DUF6062 family protein [Eubacteriales bacterium]